ncbi:MAG: acetate--CoA ligase family protein [bacterium]|nr:acetate--CoA ligase family protein [bacterium]
MNLNAIFNPQSIAIIGASTKIGSVGNDVVKNLVVDGYAGKIFPVNPNATELYNLKCSSDVLSIPEKIDLVVVAIPATTVNTVMLDVAKKGIKAAIVITAGFKEAGNPGLEEDLKNICLKNDIALIGPNCLGVINTSNKMIAAFSGIMPQTGGVAFVSQSGALCTAILDFAQKIGLGFSKFVSVGNKALVDEAMLLDYLATDPDTKVIALYIEDLKNASVLIPKLRKIIKHKPIIAIKAGRTNAGASAATSHTGALAGNDVAYDALFKQGGVIRANTITELFEHVRLFSHCQPPIGNRVAIVTNAGGPGVLTTDEATACGLDMAQLSDITHKKILSFLPASANCHNPIDILGDAHSDRYRHTLEALIADKKVDSIIVILTPQSTTDIKETAEVLIEIKKKTTKPIAVSFIGGKLVSPAIEVMRRAQVATFAFPEQAARSLAALSKYGEYQRAPKENILIFKDIDKEKVKKILNTARIQGKNSLPQAEALEILKAYSFPMLRYAVVNSVEEAEKKAKHLGKKLVFKIVSPDILHKTDVGGIMLNIDPKEAGEKYQEMMALVKKKMPQAQLDGILIEEMIDKTDTAEMILGVNYNPGLGHLIMTGAGGIFVEVFKDVSFGMAPISTNQAERMIAELKYKKILDGARGQNPLDQTVYLECLSRLSQLISDFPEIKELDINPLLITTKGAKVLDARIII